MDEMKSYEMEYHEAAGCVYKTRKYSARQLKTVTGAASASSDNVRAPSVQQ